MLLKERKLKKTTFELLCGEGKIVGISRKVVILGIYIPLKTTLKSAKSLMQEVNNIIEKQLLEFSYIPSIDEALTYDTTQD